MNSQWDNEIELEEAIAVYKIYLYTGSVSSLITLVLLLIYLCKKSLRFHPNGILIQLMICNFVLSLDYLCAGLGLFWTGNIKFSGMYNHSFFLPRTTCRLESTIMLFFFFSWIGWNFVWLFDLIRVFKYPMHTTRQFMTTYLLIVYITAFLLCDICYSIQGELFGMGPTYNCFISSSWYFYVIHIPQILYVLTSAYTIFKYGRESVITKFNKTGHKLRSFFRTQKCYFGFCIFIWALEYSCFSRNTRITRQIYAVARSLEPLILSTPWILSILQTLLIHLGCFKNDVNADEAKLLQEEEEDAGMNKNIMDDAMRKEVVEYLLKGIRKSILSLQDPRYSIDLMDNESEGCFSRFINWITSCFRSSPKEELYSHQSSSLIQYAKQLNRVNLIDSKSIARESLREQTFNILPDSLQIEKDFIFDSGDYEDFSNGVKFVSLAPKVFQNMRSLFKVNEQELINVFSIAALRQSKLIVKLQSGRCGAFFIIAPNSKYMVKSINVKEYNVMKSIMAEFYLHYLKFPRSLITPIFGCYALFLSESNEIMPQYFILMKRDSGGVITKKTKDLLRIRILKFQQQIFNEECA